MISTQSTLMAEHTKTIPLIDRTGLVIPTWNAASNWPNIANAIRKQGITSAQVLVVDSSSSDETSALALGAGFQLKIIPHESFRHGATRQLAAELLPWADVLVYLTQDALLCGEGSLEHLLEPFQNPEVGACYGRQLPRTEAGPIERHARLFNYPDKSDLRTFEDRKNLGIRAAFFSDSFAAYRRTAFEQVGGFRKNSIVSEEVSVAAHLLMAGWTIAYQAEATVTHSHNFTLREEFSRYFDIGVHHAREHWILDEFGRAGDEGKAFVLSQARFLLKSKPSLLPWAAVHNANKWCAYHLGLHERHVPQGVKEALSSQKGFWRDDRKRPSDSQNGVGHSLTAAENVPAKM
jgi:rhamnosyltransferase